MAAILGALVIMVGVLTAPSAAAHPHQATNAATGAILGWLGFLVVVFAARSWARRRWPSLIAWRPRDPDKASRVGSIALVAIIALGIVCYGSPTWVAAQFTGGPVPAWMARLAYAPDFQSTRLPWLLTLWVAQALLMAWVALDGRWRALTRRIEAGLALAVSLALIWFWAVGPMFQVDAVDHTAKVWLAPVAMLMLLYAGWKIAMLVRPPAAPPMQPGASSLATYLGGRRPASGGRDRGRGQTDALGRLADLRPGVVVDRNSLGHAPRHALALGVARQADIVDAFGRLG